MNLAVHTTRRHILPVFVLAFICAMILSSLSVRIPTVSAASTPQILISPSSAALSIGQTFTMTINMTNLTNLYDYQVVFKYNGTVLNLTNVWFPDNVFSGQQAYTAWSNDTEFAGDIVDHLNYTEAAGGLVGSESVSVSNGVLCEANFTAVGVGQATIEIATKGAPAHDERGNSWYTFCEGPGASPTEYDSFVTNTGSISIVPEFTPIVLVMMLPILGVAVLIARRKRGRRAQ